MIVIFILIGLSLIVALIFLGLFIWSVKDGQFDDDITPAMRILFDDDIPEDDNDDSNDLNKTENNIENQII